MYWYRSLYVVSMIRTSGVSHTSIFHFGMHRENTRETFWIQTEKTRFITQYKVKKRRSNKKVIYCLVLMKVLEIREFLNSSINYYSEVK